MPLVVIEAKTPVRKAVSWVDGAIQVHDDYERNVPELFVANVFSVATDGKELKLRLRPHARQLWGPWRSTTRPTLGTLSEVEQAARGLLHARDRPRHPRALHPVRDRQEEAARSRSSAATSSTRPPTASSSASSPASPKGLIWHFQGSGKSLLMVFAAQKLRLHPALGTRRCSSSSTASTSTPRSSRRSTPPTSPTSRRPTSRKELQHLLPGCPQGHHHDNPQVRRGRRRAQRARQHHRPRRRGPPHAGGRPRREDARGAAERVPLRADRHAHQPPRPQHLLRVRRGGGREAAT